MDEYFDAQYDYSLLAWYGEDVFISRDVVIKRPHLMGIGSHVAIDIGFYCTVRATLGDYIHIPPYVTVIGGKDANLYMKHFSTMAAGCRVICASDEYLGLGLCGPTMPPEHRDKVMNAPVVFEMFASIGTNVVVMPGVTLGEGSVVGACSLVTKDTEPWTIYVGIPAKPMKSRPKDRMIQAAQELGYVVKEKK